MDLLATSGMIPSWLQFTAASRSFNALALLDNLPLFLQLLFGETYLVVKKSGINLVCQHLMANPKPNIPFQFNHVYQLEQCRQDLCDGLTAVFCYKVISFVQAQSAGILQGLHRSVEPTAQYDPSERVLGRHPH